MFNLKSLLLAILISIFIFFESLNCNYFLLNTIAALYSIYLLLTLYKKELYFAGFFTGIIWFWWVGYSFIYYELSYMIPIVIILIGAVYGLLFYFGGFFSNPFLRAGYFYIVSFIDILGFNWFKLELPFVNSYLGISKVEFFFIVLATALLVYFIEKNRFKLSIWIYSTLIVILALINITSNKNIENSKLDIEMVTTDVAQNEKWDFAIRDRYILKYISMIDKAIEDNKDLIVFPETAFPVVLNDNKRVEDMLLERSKSISIITGALYIKDGLFYNSTYLFENGSVEVAHKVVLVPFGEAVPLPEKLRDWINDSFYNGAKDYETAEMPTTFNIKGEKFRSAICYEATTDEIYENLDTKYAIAISNNAWFVPSTQPDLQRVLLRYYAKKYNILIYSITNKSKSGIIRP